MTGHYLKIVDSNGDRIPASAVAGVYEAASSGRRLSTWGTSTAGPNSAIFSSLSTLRARSRELTRNNPNAFAAIDSFVSNLIGAGITPRWQVEDSGLKKEIQQLWADWTEEADYAGACDFYGLQALAARAVIEAGEAFGRFRPQRSNGKLTVPLQIQGLEGDHLDAAHSTIAPNKNEIRMGIEFRKDGKRAAYWLFRNHPGEAFLLANNSERVRVPASEIMHIYRPLRLGQIRGRPWMAPIIITLHDLDQYEDAELVRKKTAAMFGGFITQDAPYGMRPPFGKPSGESSSAPGEPEIIAMEPGTFPILREGQDVKFAEPADVGGSYESWIKQQLHKIAKGIGTTYEQLTGDLEGVNYSSIRAGLLEFRRLCKMIQRQTLIFQFCRPVARCWMDMAVASGALKIADYRDNRRKYLRIKWRGEGWDWVDPVKDQVAEKLAVRCGFKSRAQVIAERGFDIEDIDCEISEDNKRADELGLIFDSDPRKTPNKSTPGARP